MMKSVVVFTVLMFTSLFSFAATEEFEFLESPLTLKSKDSKVLKSLVEQMNVLKGDFFKGLENECLYKDARNEECRAEIDYAFNTKLKVKEIVSESKKNYRQEFLKSNKKSNKASLLNGISIIEDAKSKVSSPWQMNYRGQLFQSEGSKKTLYISTPLFPTVAYASADEYSGWMISQNDDISGGPETRKKKKVLRSDFLKVILLGAPDFSGARLLGWSKALMLGGQKLLKKLEKNKKYQGKWAYIYFDQTGTPVCSSNVECDFENPQTRKIKVRW